MFALGCATPSSPVPASPRPVAPAPQTTGATIHGRVLLDARPVTSFEILASRADGAAWGPHTIVARDGAFTISEIESGEWEIFVRGEGFAGHVPKQSVAVGETVDVGDINVHHGFTVQGAVYGDDGQPLPGATVTLTGGTGRNQLTRTDERGRYRFQDVESSSPSHSIQALRPDRGVSLDVSIDNKGTTIDLVVRRTGSLDVTVNAPAKDVPLVLLRAAGDRRGFVRGRPAVNGVFSFDEVPEGDYDLELISHPYVPQQAKRVIVTAGQRAAVTLP